MFDSILDEINSINCSHEFISWRDSNRFAQSIVRIIYNIEILLLPIYPKEALTALNAVLKASPQIIESVDDSSDVGGNEFRYAVIVWGKIWNQLPDFDGNELANAIWDYFDENDYGLYDDIISSAAG